MKKSKTLVYISDYVPVGGSKTFFEGLSFECKKKDIKCLSILFTDINLHINEKNTDKNIFLKISKLNFYSIPFRVIKLIPVLRNIKNEYLNITIVTDLVLPGMTTILTKYFLMMNAKINYQLHGLNFLEKQSRAIYDDNNKIIFKIKQLLRKITEIIVLRNVNKIICFSDYSMLLLNNHVPNHSLAVKVLPGLENEMIKTTNKLSKSETRILLSLPANKNILLYVGRIEPRKGIFSLLKELKNKSPSFYKKNVLIFVSSYSDGRFIYDFFEQHKQLELGTKILFYNSPSRNELSLLFRASDVLLLPSTELETFGFVTLEALTCDTPTVGFNIGANKEIIDKDMLADVNIGMSDLFIKSKLYLESRSRKTEINRYMKKIKNIYSWSNYIDNLFSQ